MSHQPINLLPKQGTICWTPPHQGSQEPILVYRMMGQWRQIFPIRFCNCGRSNQLLYAFQVTQVIFSSMSINEHIIIHLHRAATLQRMQRQHFFVLKLVGESPPNQNRISTQSPLIPNRIAEQGSCPCGIPWQIAMVSGKIVGGSCVHTP